MASSKISEYELTYSFAYQLGCMQRLIKKFSNILFLYLCEVEKREKREHSFHQSLDLCQRISKGRLSTLHLCNSVAPRVACLEAGVGTEIFNLYQAHYQESIKPALTSHHLPKPKVPNLYQNLRLHKNLRQRT